MRTVRGLAVRIAQWTRPIPNLDIVSGCTRKRKLQALELLTGSPVKRLQIEKKKRKNLNVTKSTYARVKKRKTKPRQPECKKQYFCIVCNELYVDPPTEDWIQCSKCSNWSHESCTTYKYVGLYYCNKQTVHWLIPHQNVQYLHLILMCLIEMQQT